MNQVSKILILTCFFSCEQRANNYNRLDISGTPKTITVIKEEVTGLDTVRSSNIYMKSMRVNTWDTKGKMLTSQFSSFDLANKRFSLGYIDKFTYDDRDQILFEETYDNEDKITHKFQHTKHNKIGLHTETKLLQGEAVDSIVTSYSSDKMITNEFADGKRIAEQVKNYKDGFIESERLTYFGDVDGDVIIYTWNYKYFSIDKNKNWTKRLIMENDSNCPCYLETRIIEY